MALNMLGLAGSGISNPTSKPRSGCPSKNGTILNNMSINAKNMIKTWWASLLGQSPISIYTDVEIRNLRGFALNLVIFFYSFRLL